MGIDYGLKRIGIAMTDFLRIIANPFDTVKNVSLKKNALKILEIAKNNGVSVIVLGLPLNMNGTEGGMAETVRKFIEEIKFLSDIEVTTVDERLTTVQAERMLIEEADISREKRKNLKDKVAAALILQTYLDMQAEK
jgi:putative Holliday junction resolvase